MTTHSDGGPSMMNSVNKKTVDLGETVTTKKPKVKKQKKKIKKEEPKKQKMIFLNIKTALTFMIDLYDTEKARKYIVPMAKSMITSVDQKEVKQSVFELFDVKDVLDMRRKHEAEYTILVAIFGMVYWQ